MSFLYYLYTIIVCINTSKYSFYLNFCLSFSNFIMCFFIFILFIFSLKMFISIFVLVIELKLPGAKAAF